MSQNLNPGSPIAPLNIGNVVSAGVRLYSSNLRTYLKLALFAHLWVLVPIYGLAKYVAISGLISRLAFGELISKPESVGIARSAINPRLWSFLRVAFQVGISLILVYLGLAILGGILMIIIGGILAVILGRAGVAIATTLGIILLVIILIVGLTWYYSRWVIAEVPLAVEERINGGESVARSWELTKASVLRILGIVITAFAVTLPIVALFNYLPQIFLIRVEQGSNIYWTIYFISALTSLAGGVLVMPFWQSLKAVLYYDLRNRREGLGLQLRDRNT